MEIKRTKNNFGRIGVLMGGASTEREISLKSGKAVLEAFKGLGLDVVDIDITTENIDDNMNLIRSKSIDCAFLALHGHFGEDGRIQEILERLKIPYTGSGVQASKLAMDKVASRRIFEAHGLSAPHYEVFKKKSYNSAWQDNGAFSLPWVIKPASHGSSIGLSIINNKEVLAKAIGLAFSFDETIIIEEYVSGRELTVGILEECALPIIEIVPKNTFFDYDAKYKSGMTDYIVPAQLHLDTALKVQEAALSAHKLLGCSGCSRVDIILSRDGSPYILEVNTIPGLTSTSLLPKAAKAKGIEFAHLCLKLINLAHEKKKS